jgi:hypothetical protein
MRSWDYWNLRDYVLLVVDNDDHMTTILIVILRQIFGNDLGVRDGIGRPSETRSLVVFDRQCAGHNVEKVQWHNTPVHLSPLAIVRPRL